MVEVVNEQYTAESLLHDFKLKPMELKQILDKSVVGQENAKIILSTALCSHYSKVKCESLLARKTTKTPKSNVLLVGPPGCGKTALLKSASNHIGFPFHICDASKFTCSGYVGDTVTDMVQNLYFKSGNNPGLTELGIILVDEIDKIHSDSGSSGRDISGARVQEELLTMLEGTEVSFTAYSRKGGRDVTIDMSNILFILGGAFVDINTPETYPLGFNLSKTNNPTSEIHQRLRSFGMIDQLIGRIRYIAELDLLSVSQLEGILNLENSDIKQGVINEFAGAGIDLKFMPDGISMLAKKAYDLGYGGRGLGKALHEVLLHFQYSLPSTTVKHLEVTQDLVLDPVGTLERILKNHPPLVDLGSQTLKPYVEEKDLDDSVRKNSQQISQIYGELKQEGLPRRFRDSAAKFCFENNFCDYSGRNF